MATELKEYRLKEDLRIRGSNHSGWSKKGATVKLDLKTAQSYHRSLDPDPGPRPKAAPALSDPNLGRWMARKLEETVEAPEPEAPEPSVEAEDVAEPQESAEEAEPEADAAPDEDAPEPEEAEVADEPEKTPAKKPARRRRRSTKS